MGWTFAGDHSDFTATIAVEYRTSKDLLDQLAVGRLQDFGRGHDRVGLGGSQAAIPKKPCEHGQAPCIGLDDLGPELNQGFLKHGHLRFVKVARIQENLLADQAR